MNQQFSTTSNRGDAVCNCQQGNIFYLGNPEDVKIPPIQVAVNNKSSGTLPMGQVVNDKTDEISGPLSLKVSGRNYKIFDDIGKAGDVNIPNQVKVNIGIGSPIPASETTEPLQENGSSNPENRPNVPVGQVSSMRPPGVTGHVPIGYETNALDVLGDQNGQYGNLTVAHQRYLEAKDKLDIIIVEAERQNGAPPDGEHDAEEQGPAWLAWYTEEIGKLIKIAGKQAITVGFLLSDGNNWEVLRREGLTRFYVKTINGKKMMIFKGRNGLRRVLTGSKYTLEGLKNRQVSVMDAAVRTAGQNISKGATSIARKAGAVGFVFVCAVDTIGYFSQPESERVLSDLMIDLGFNAVKAVISGIAGTVAAGLAITVLGAFTAPVLLGVAVGLATAFLVGYGVSWLIDKTGLEEKMKAAYRAQKPREGAYEIQYDYRVAP